MEREATPATQAGARWAQAAYPAIAKQLGRRPTTDELEEFMMAAIDVVFSSTYGTLRDKLGDDRARAWTDRVMGEIAQSLRDVVGAEVSIQIVSRK